jgi:LasA protease
MQGMAHSLMPDIDVGKYDSAFLSGQSMPKLVDDNNFVYRPTVNPFVLSEYFSAYPQWQPLEEALLHWCGAFGVDPRVVLTTIAISKNWSPTLEANALLIDVYRQEIKVVADHLSQMFYHFDKEGALSTNAASYAIASLFGDKKQIIQWQEQYNTWFGKQTTADSLNISAIPQMQWPWRAGYSWTPNGPHSHTGSGYPLSSIDVSYDWPSWGGQTYSVTAAHDGKVSVFSRCQLRVTHPDGWATNYYHMDGIDVRDGDWVDKNQRIGTYASQKNVALCQGGSSTGPHLHFSLLYNGRFQSLQGVSFGPYKIDVGRYNYDSNCSYTWMYDSRSNSRKCFWNRVDNP